MTVVEAELELDQDIDDYLEVALAAGTKTGFSKGTADVSAADLKKLRPLIKFYAKKPHPFRACVKDNRKRFGPLTEKYCAIIKDLIEGNTKWRNQKGKKDLSESTLAELFGLPVDGGFIAFLAELGEDEVQEIIEESEESEENKDMSLSQDTDYNDEPHLLAEMYFADENSELEPEADSDGLIWKPILREGVWKFSPGAGQQAQAKPITVVKSGKSDKDNMVISMAELKRNFENGAVEHVTIPTSHADTVLENTGYVRKLRYTKDAEGRTVLEAGMDFTDPDVKNKATLGSIANTSAGILFDYIHKESGKKFRSVLAHAALTNRPWLNGMRPFGVNASDDLGEVEIVHFAQDDHEVVEEAPIDDPATTGGGEEMSETTLDFSELGFSSADELKEALAEREALRAESRQRDVTDLCSTWQEEGKAPALVSEAKNIMMSDKGGVVLNLSEDGKNVELSATEIVKRLVAAAPAVQLAQDPVSDEDTSRDRPNDTDDVVELSQEVKTLATSLYINEGLSYEKAVVEAEKRLASDKS